MKSLTRFGTYGFLSTILAAQLALAPSGFGDSAQNNLDRAKLDVKKTARSAKRDLKKAGRNVTGQESKWKDFKDEAADAARNTQDEVKHEADKITK